MTNSDWHSAQASSRVAVQSSNTPLATNPYVEMVISPSAQVPRQRQAEMSDGEVCIPTYHPFEASRSPAGRTVANPMFATRPYQGSELRRPLATPPAKPRPKSAGSSESGSIELRGSFPLSPRQDATCADMALCVNAAAVAPTPPPTLNQPTRVAEALLSPRVDARVDRKLCVVTLKASCSLRC